MTATINGVPLSEAQYHALVYAIGAGENSVQIKKPYLISRQDKNKAILYEMALTDIRKLLCKKQENQ